MSSSNALSSLKSHLSSRGITSLPPDSLLESILSIEGNDVERASKMVLDDLVASGVRIPSSDNNQGGSSYSSGLSSGTGASNRRRIGGNGMNFEGIGNNSSSRGQGLGSGSSSSLSGNGAGLHSIHSNSNSNSTLWYFFTLPFSFATSLIGFLLRLVGLRSILPYLGLSNHDHRRINGPSSRGKARPMFSDPKKSSEDWIEDLEGLVGGKCRKSTGNEEQMEGQTNGTQDGFEHEGRLQLPPFERMSYKEVIEQVKKPEQGKILVVVLTCGEHQDDEEFKKNTLTYQPLVNLLSSDQFICWGGDVQTQEAWDVSNLLQASTYPFVAFISLRPTPTAPNSNPTSTPSSQLSILSRHEGSSLNDGPTCGPILTNHITSILLPRVTPFLNRIKNQALSRVEERRLRREQEEAYERAAREDSERILRKREENMRREREQRLEKERMETEKKKKIQEKEKKKREIERKMNRREEIGKMLKKDFRPELEKTQEKNGFSDLNFTLPSGRKLNRVFDKDDDLSQVFAFVEVYASKEPSASTSTSTTNASNSNSNPTSASSYPTPSSDSLTSFLLNHHDIQFSLLTGYPRKRIEFNEENLSKRIEEVEGLVPAARVLVEGEVDEIGWEEEEDEEADGDEAE